MRTQALYLVTPNQELTKATADMEDGIKSAFSDEILISGHESDRSSWRQEDYIVRAKLAFLIDLRSEYSNAPEFKLLFGEQKVSVGLFDKWWNLKRYEISLDVDDIEPIQKGELEFTSRSRVNEWLATKTTD